MQIITVIFEEDLQANGLYESYTKNLNQKFQPSIYNSSRENSCFPHAVSYGRKDSFIMVIMKKQQHKSLLMMHKRIIIGEGKSELLIR